MRHILFLILFPGGTFLSINGNVGIKAQSCSARISAKSRLEAINKKSDFFHLHAKRLLLSGEKLLLWSDLGGGDATEKCSRVVQAYETGYKYIMNREQKPGVGENLDRIIILLNGSPVEKKPIVEAVSTIFNLLRSSKLAGRFGSGWYLTIPGQLEALQFFLKSPRVAERLVAVLKQFKKRLSEWQNKGQNVIEKSKGSVFTRSLRKAFAWVFSEPRFTFPPGYLLALLCAVASRPSASQEEEVLRIFSAPEKTCKKKEMVEKILLALENVFVNNQEGLEWLAVLRGKVPSLFTAMLEMDIIMTKRKKVEPLEALEMGARVPGELFARLMLDFDTTKPGALSNALKGLKEFTKFVVFSGNNNNNVEVDRQKILINGSRLIFGLLDSAVTEEAAKELRAIKWKNSKGMFGNVAALGTVMLLVTAAETVFLTGISPQLTSAVSSMASLAGSLEGFPSGVDFLDSNFKYQVLKTNLGFAGTVLGSIVGSALDE